MTSDCQEGSCRGGFGNENRIIKYFVAQIAEQVNQTCKAAWTPL